MVAGLALAVACIAFSVLTVIRDPDFWQHLAVGRAIDGLLRVPTVNLWAWPVYGVPDVCPSWLFRALLWPFWRFGQVAGLYAWRELTTLAAFFVLWLTARRLGARELGTLFVLVLAALTWRHRSQVRPETLVAILLALELWLLETWRVTSSNEPRFSLQDHRLAVAPLIWIWVNTHISWPLGFVVLGAYALDALLLGRAGPRLPRTLEFLAIAVAAGALAFANPSGPRAVAQPFDFFLHQRHDPLYATIGELAPLRWSAHWRSGLPLLLAGWPLVLLRHAFRRGVDVAEALLCVAFTVLAIASQRFAGFYVLVAAPFAARGLSDWLAGHIRFSRSAVRFACFAVATLGLSALEWTRPETPVGIGIDLSQYPVGACDYLESRGLRGPLFNEYYNGGYLLWRFWPDRTRLPFMDVHQSGTPEDRKLYPYVFASADAWRTLDQRREFQVLLVDGSPRAIVGNRLPDILDADTTWALVFRDDNACVYVRRSGDYADVAAEDGYSILGGGEARLIEMGPQLARSAAFRDSAYREITRQLESSRWNARASSLLANLDFMSGRIDDARSHLAHALTADPRASTAHERLGLIALRAGDPRAALREFDAEARIGEGSGELDLHRGQALEALGRRADAAKAYRRQLSKAPEDREARESLDRVSAARPS